MMFKSMPPKKIHTTHAVRKIFILDDHPVFREGLSNVLNSEPDLTVCGVAGSAEAALAALSNSQLKPDLILVDIGLPGMNGLEFIKKVRAVNRVVKLLVVSMHDEALYAERVLKAGGDGYIMKQENPEEIANAIRDVLGGHIYVSENILEQRVTSIPKQADKLKARPLDHLTDSELEVLEALGYGQSPQEISKNLNLSVAEVRTRLSRIKTKLNLNKDKALFRYAVCWVETGSTEPDDSPAA